MSERLVIVDDDAWVRRALTDLLEHAGFAVVGTAANAVDAIGQWRAERPDAVLMDINMPGELNGIDAIRVIADANDMTRIVVLTTVAPGPGLRRAFDAGAWAAVDKAAAPDELLGLLKELLECEERPRRHVVAGVPATTMPDWERDGAAPELTPREHEVLQLVCRGWSAAQIGRHCGITEWTAKTHIRRVREKLGAQNQAQMIVRAAQYRFVVM